MAPVREKWWDLCVGRFTAPYYRTKTQARAAKEIVAGNRATTKSKQLKGYFIWGDRVQLISGDPASDKFVKVAGRGAEVWMRSEHLGGKPLLELYVIDVGQGDGLLLVTPEGHHIMVDGGDTRSRQTTGKNAADFVDWKFFDDYLRKKDRGDPDKARIKLDAMVASHNDADHFGGLLDLLDFRKPKNKAELDCVGVEVEKFYHAGLSWWVRFTSSGKKKRTLGRTTGGFYTKLLEGRQSAIDATRNLDSPDTSTLSGQWGKCIAAAVACKKASDSSEPTAIERISTRTHDWLPGFADTDAESEVKIRVLGPVSEPVGQRLGLKKFKDGDSKNTNGHSIVLRVDYGKRRLLLTGDLNTHSQNYLMEKHDQEFAAEFQVDVAKGCHHGSGDISYKFLKALMPVATVISSGDTESYDHPRPTIVSASALTGRKLLDDSGEHLVAPLVYMTEISRSYDVAKVYRMLEFDEKQPVYERNEPEDAVKTHKTVTEMGHFRLVLNNRPKSAFDLPRLDKATTVRGLVYGLINVRTDGETLFFAAMEEKGKDWSVTTLDDGQISSAGTELP